MRRTRNIEETIMRLTCTAVCLLTLMGCALCVARAQETSQTSRPIYAQQLVNKTLSGHPSVIVMAFHVTPPNQADNVIIASNIGRIGKKADEDDLRVIRTGKSNLEVNKNGDRFEDELPLLDRSGKIIGAVGIVFPYKQGDDKAKLAKTAEEIRNDMRRQIPSREKLFEQVDTR